MSPREAVGQQVAVHGMPFRAVVTHVVALETDDVVLHLDWGEHGTSRVFWHDKGSVWCFHLEVN